MFKNALVCRIAHWTPPPTAAVEERLGAQRFAECGATQAESTGWVEPRGERHAPLLEVVGGQWLLRLALETKAVPTSVVKQRLETELDRIEHDSGRRPKGKRAKEVKEQIVHELLPRAFPKRSHTWVWVDPAARLVLIDAGSAARADRVASLLVDALGGGIVLAPLQTQSSPAVAMARWLKEREAPCGFAVDRECELRQPDSDKAAVRYARHALDIDEIGRHIDDGKLPTRLALTWGARVSFVLTETMALKRIQLLDVVLDTRGDDDASFDTDVALFTGELRRLVPDLVEALDGEQPAASAA